MVGSVAAGVALIAALDIVNVSVLKHFRATIEDLAGKAQLQVAVGTGEIGFEEELASVVATEPGVRHAFALVKGTLVSTDSHRDVLQLIAVDMGSEAKDAYEVSVVDQQGDDLEVLNDPTSVFVGAEHAARRGIPVGSHRTFATPTGIKTLRVRGLLQTRGLAKVFGGNLAVMDLPAAQLLLGKGRNIDQVDVVLEDGAALADVRDRLRRRLPESLTVTPPAQRGEHFERIIRAFQALLIGISVFCLLAGIFVVYNTIGTALHQRAPELATLVAVGARPRTVFLLILAETAIVGVIASGIGVAVGSLLARLLLGFVAQSMAMVYNTRFTAPSCVPSWANVGWYVAVGGAAAIVAALVPAAHASRIDALRVLRPVVGDDFRLGPTRQRLLSVGAVLLALTGVIVVIVRSTQSIVWGNVASALWAVSATILVIPLMASASKALHRVLGRLFSVSGEIAGAGLTRSPERTGVTTAVIGLTLGVAVVIASVAHSFRETMRNWFILTGDLVVSSMATEGSWLAMPVDAKVGDALQQIPGVDRVETYRVLPGQEYRDMRIAIVGVSPGFVDGALFRKQIVDGDAEAVVRAVRDGGGAVVSEIFADHFRVRSGDDLVLPTPGGIHHARIAGVIAGDFSGDHGSIMLPRSVVEKLWNDTRVSQFHLFLRPGIDPAVVRDRIGEALGDRYLLKILSLPETLAYHQAKSDEAFAFTYAIQLLVVVVTLAGIVDLLMTEILERRLEIGILRGIGTDDWRIARAVRLEAFVIGVAGALFGMLVGIGGALLWVRLNVHILLGYVLEPHFDVRTAAVSVVLATATAVVAGQLAARSALRAPVLDAIRVE